MRILVDECLDWRIVRALGEHDAVSVQKMGWSGIQNGRLLEAARGRFEVLLTSDRNLSYQQNLSRYEIAVIVLATKSTRLVDTLPIMPMVCDVLAGLQPGELIVIGTDGVIRIPEH